MITRLQRRPTCAEVGWHCDVIGCELTPGRHAAGVGLHSNSIILYYLRYDKWGSRDEYGMAWYTTGSVYILVQLTWYVIVGMCANSKRVNCQAPIHNVPSATSSSQVKLSIANTSNWLKVSFNFVSNLTLKLTFKLKQQLNNRKDSVSSHHCMV